MPARILQWTAGDSHLQAIINPAMGSLVLYLAAILVLIYAVWGLGLLFMQPKLLYRPMWEINFTPADMGLEYTDVVFQSADGVRLTGWYVPVKNAPFTILLCHGNGGNIMHMLDSLNLFYNLGLSCFAFDYRGYGNSSGRPTEAGTYLDAQAAYDWLMGEKGVPADQIILLGRSLGGSVAAHLAGRVQPAALVVESAFTSFVDFAAGVYPYLPVRLFTCCLFRYDTLACVKGVRCPVMVMHSRDDELVPFVFATRLFEAAGAPKQFVEIFGNHNDGFLLSGDVYKGAWLKWLDFVKDRQSENLVRDAS
jgi:fermentation-respiration switch protein FrsA (DUF1100 family)